MKILLACDSSRVNEYLAIQFVKEGIVPYKSLDPVEVVQLLDEKSIDSVLVDFDSTNFEGFETIKELRVRFNQLIIILLTSKTGIEFAKKSMELGVFGIVSKSEDLESQFKTAIALLDNLKTRRTEKRKHMRVSPAELQHNSFVLKIPGLTTKYFGKVRNISLGGVAAVFDQDVADLLLFKGKEVELEIELGFINISGRANVVIKRNRDIGLFFKELGERQKKQICEYIIQRIS